jgi:hypothetical protein
MMKKRHKIETRYIQRRVQKVGMMSVVLVVVAMAVMPVNRSLRKMTPVLRKEAEEA